MNKYDFKWRPELAFALWSAALMTAFQLLTTADPEKVTDWKMWAVSGLAAVARAVGAAGVNFMVRLVGST